MSRNVQSPHAAQQFDRVASFLRPTFSVRRRHVAQKPSSLATKCFIQATCARITHRVRKQTQLAWRTAADTLPARPRVKVSHRRTFFGCLQRRVAAKKMRHSENLVLRSSGPCNGRGALPHPRYSNIIRTLCTDTESNATRAPGDYVSHAAGAMCTASVRPCFCVCGDGLDRHLPPPAAVRAVFQTALLFVHKSHWQCR